MIHKLISRYVRCEHVSSLVTQQTSIMYQKLFRRSYIFCPRNVIMFMGSDRFQTYTYKLLQVIKIFATNVQTKHATSRLSPATV